jgi:hypothetical protein
MTKVTFDECKAFAFVASLLAEAASRHLDGNFLTLSVFYSSAGRKRVEP